MWQILSEKKAIADKKCQPWPWGLADISRIPGQHSQYILKMAKNGYRLVKRYNISDVEIQRMLTDTTPSKNPKSISDTDKFLFQTCHLPPA